MDAARIFVPLTNNTVDCIFIKSIFGELYSLTAIIGSDQESGTDFFIINRSACDENDLPADGAWREVDPKRTKLRTEYRYQEEEAYKDFQELHEVQFWTGNSVTIIKRKADEFGIEKLLIEYNENYFDNS
jgi:hypothetical protein